MIFSPSTIIALFLLTPLREGRRPFRTPRARRSHYFYSRPCGRGDFVGLQLVNVDHFISTHAPAGGATKNQGWAACVESISTHAPAGGATAPVPVRSPAGGYFYSRPCGRGDSIVLRFDLKDQISTHAPAGGATGTAQLGGREGSYFYSRPCGRGDRRQQGSHTVRSISTHAPAGGATAARIPRCRRILHFYSRPCGRGDRCSRRARTAAGTFLLTPLREGRPATPTRRSISSSFLLTPLREGRLRHAEKGRRNNPISTHAPAGGATPERVAISFCMQISTHAPAGGATRRRRTPLRRSP